MIKPTDLRAKEGGSLLGNEQTSELVKSAIFYLQEKVKDWDGKKYKAWLLEKRDKATISFEESIEIDRDIMSPKFAFLQKKRDELRAGISIVIDYLLMANDMVDINKEVKYLTPDPYQED